MNIGSLFSGIGGLELGLERAGLGRVVWQAEIDPWCRTVLAKHWPEAMRFDDVRAIGRATAAPVDVVCGGFPCQDVSLAGKRAGLAGERSGLWSEYRRIIEELAPSVVIIENVLGLRSSGLPRVLADLAALGFDAEWSDLAAADVGAPHLRRRLFIAATHPERVQLRLEPGWLGRACRAAASESRDDGEGRATADADALGWCWRAWHVAESNRKRESSDGHCDAPDADSARLEERRVIVGDDGSERSPAERVGSSRDASDADCEGQPQSRRSVGTQWRRSGDGGWWPPVSPIRRVDDGIHRGSHGRRLKALGNAVVPQCAEVIGRAIVASMEVTQ